MNGEKKDKFWRQTLKWVIVGLVGLAVFVLIFGAGMFVGLEKARFSYLWAESYHKNFAGPRQGFVNDWRRLPMPNDFMEAHGAFGEIIELKDSGFVIRGRGDMERLIITTRDTVIKKGAETIEDGLKVGDYVVVIGGPNQEGQIEAKLVRLFEEKTQ